MYLKSNHDSVASYPFQLNKSDSVYIDCHIIYSAKSYEMSLWNLYRAENLISILNY